MAIRLSEKQINDGWKIVKFGEIAREVKLTTKNPLENGLEFYVGLEHLDPQGLRILRKGIIAEDKPSFTRRFLAGHILFGKRRCYQKKAAVADFDGICSGDIIVIEAIPQKIVANLLPFIIQSDVFFDWAEKTSSGSLSPRTKWKSLAEFEFPLPRAERQQEILDELEKVSFIDDKIYETSLSINRLQEAFFRDYFAKKLKIEEVFCRPLQIRSSSKIYKLNELIEGKIQNGLFVQKDKIHNNTVKFLNVQDIYAFPPKNLDELCSVTCSEKELASFKLNTGDLIFNRSSLVKEGIGWAFLFSSTSPNVVFDCHLMRVKPGTKLLPEYLAMYSISPWARKYFLATSQTITMTTIGQQELGALQVPVPDLSIQTEIVDIYKNLTKTAKALHMKQGYFAKLKSKIISTVLCKGEVSCELQ
jgi:type I restriction enzyme S subunit